MAQNPFDKYKQAQVLTASPEKILLLLYSGAIKFLKQAMEASERKDILEKTRLVGRTQDIINELRATLNFKASPEIAGELEKLYIFIGDALLKSAQSTEIKPLEEALKVLVTLNEAWVGAVNNMNQPPALIQEDK